MNKRTSIAILVGILSVLMTGCVATDIANGLTAAQSLWAAVQAILPIQ